MHFYIYMCKEEDIDFNMWKELLNKCDTEKYKNANTKGNSNIVLQVVSLWTIS